MKSKIITLLTVSALFISCAETNEEKTENDQSTSSEHIDETGSSKKEINVEEYIIEVDALADKKSTQIDWTDKKHFDLMESTEGGNLTFYFEGDKIGKIEEEHIGETGFRLNEYYFKDGEFAKVNELVVRYNYPYYMDEYDPTLDKFYEDQTYFFDGKMVERVECEKDEDYVGYNDDMNPEERILTRLNELFAHLEN